MNNKKELSEEQKESKEELTAKKEWTTPEIFNLSLEKTEYGWNGLTDDSNQQS